MNCAGLNDMGQLVSVILPTFNRSRSLHTAAKSVLDQSYRDLELIIVDDASTEDIASVAASLDDERVRYVRHDRNTGAAGARNTGLVHAKGELIAFQDSDDIWLPRKLERQVSLLEQQPPGVGAVTGSKVIYGVDERGVTGPGRISYAPAAGKWISLGEDQVRRSLLENRISLQNALFWRDCYPDPVWFETLAKANNDWEFIVRLVQHSRIYEDPDPVVFAYISADSISRRPRKKALGMLRILNKNRALYERYPKQHGEFLFNLSRPLHRAGRRQAARRVLLRSLMMRPKNFLLLFETLGRRAAEVLGKPRRSSHELQ